MVNVLKDSGEGRFFFKTGWCEEVLKKSCPGATGKRVGRGAFLHNVIYSASEILISSRIVPMHYNATLCKKAWGKKLLA